MIAMIRSDRANEPLLSPLEVCALCIARGEKGLKCCMFCVRILLVTSANVAFGSTPPQLAIARPVTDVDKALAQEQRGFDPCRGPHALCCFQADAG